MSEAVDTRHAEKKSLVGVDPYSLPLEQIDPSEFALFYEDEIWGWFERLRAEAPVHFCAESGFGPYVSPNRDEGAIDRANESLTDRTESKKHLSFGWGVDFCMGSRTAELQLRVLWDEIMKRYRFVEVAGEPVRTKSCFGKGFSELPVRLHSW